MAQATTSHYSPDSKGTAKPSIVNTPPHERIWNPEQGIVFSTSPAYSGGRNVQPRHTRYKTLPRNVRPHSLDGRRAFSTSSLSSLATEGPLNLLQSRRTVRVKSNVDLLHQAEQQRVTEPIQEQSTLRGQKRSTVYMKATNGDSAVARLLSQTIHLMLQIIITPLSLLQHIVHDAFSYAFPRKWSLLKPFQTPEREYWTYRTGRKWWKIPRIRVCVDLKTADAVAAEFLEATAVGLDLEWHAGASTSSSIQSNISVIQVAKGDLIALFHIARFPGSEPSELLAPNLKRVIESPRILKTGVNIAGDCTRLRKYLGVEAQGVIELSATYRLIKYHNGPPSEVRKINKTLVSLATQVEEHLGLPLFKENDVRASDWSQPLSEKQTLYAASDAYACLCLWNVLDTKRQALDPTPPRPSFHELKLPIRLANGMTVAEYLEYIEDSAE